MPTCGWIHEREPYAAEKVEDAFNPVNLHAGAIHNPAPDIPARKRRVVSEVSSSPRKVALTLYGLHDYGSQGEPIEIRRRVRQPEVNSSWERNRRWVSGQDSRSHAHFGAGGSLQRAAQLGQRQLGERDALLDHPRTHP